MRLRTQRLALAPSAAVLAVVRIESRLAHAPVSAASLIAGLLDIANQPGVRGLQSISMRAFQNARSIERCWNRFTFRSP